MRMRTTSAIYTLKELDKKGLFVFTIQDLSKIFSHNNNRKSLEAGLDNFVRLDILQKACRGVYVNHHTNSKSALHVIEYVAKALRRGKYNYISIESILPEYGVVSHVMSDRITVMTTGRSGKCQTPYGVIEFTHTRRPPLEALKDIHKVEGRPLLIESKEIARLSLKRVGRNIDFK